MVYKNKIEVVLEGKLYPIDSKWRANGTPYIESRVKVEWFDDEVLELDDIKPLDRLKYFREYPDEYLVTIEYLEVKERELTDLKRIYHEELLDRHTNRLKDLTEGTKIFCIGKYYFFKKLIKSSKGLDILALSYLSKNDGTPSKRLRELPLHEIVVANNGELTKLLSETLKW